MAEGNDVSNIESKNIDDSQPLVNTANAELVRERPGGSLNPSDLQATSQATVSQILNHETVLTQFSFMPSTSIGTVLHSQEISPSKMVNGDYPSRVSYLSEFYKFWRGSFKFRFIFTKTILQQCKILAVFVPGNTSASTPPTIDESYFWSHKIVINPANETEWTLDIPFISTRPYLETSESTGMLYMILFQPLVNSSGADTAITGTMFVAANLDMHEFKVLPQASGGTTEAVFEEDELWIVSATTVQGMTVSGPTTNTVSFQTDSGYLIPTVYSVVLDYDYPNNMVRGHVLMADRITYGGTIYYDSTTMRTIKGTAPLPNVVISWGREVVLVADTFSGNAANVVFGVVYKIGESFFLKTLSSVTTSDSTSLPSDVSAVSGVYLQPNSTTLELQRMRSEIQSLRNLVHGYDELDQDVDHVRAHGLEGGDEDFVLYNGVLNPAFSQSAIASVDLNDLCHAIRQANPDDQTKIVIRNDVVSFLFDGKKRFVRPMTMRPECIARDLFWNVRDDLLQLANREPEWSTCVYDLVNHFRPADAPVVPRYQAWSSMKLTDDGFPSMKALFPKYQPDLRRCLAESLRSSIGHPDYYFSDLVFPITPGLELYSQLTERGVDLFPRPMWMCYSTLCDALEVDVRIQHRVYAHRVVGDKIDLDIVAEAAKGALEEAFIEEKDWSPIDENSLTPQV